MSEAISHQNGNEKPKGVAMDTLESRSLWYRYKTEVWTADTPETAAIHNIMRVLRSVRNTRTLAYVSAPITTGQIFYNLASEVPALPPDFITQTAIDRNYLAGHELTEALIERRGCAVLYPADLVPARQKWSQVHFQALWLSIVAEKCTEMHMADGWDLSSGCVEEFTHAFQLRLGIPRHPHLIFLNTKEDERSERERMRTIEIFDRRGRVLLIEDGIEAIASAVKWLSGRGFSTERLNRCLELLEWTKRMIANRFYQ